MSDSPLSGIMAANSKADNISHAQYVEKSHRIRKVNGLNYGLVKARDWLYREVLLHPKSDYRRDNNIGGLYGTAGGIFSNSDFSAPEGLKVYWPNGAQAGTVRNEHKLDSRQLKKNGDMSCTQLPWRPGKSKNADFVLCYKSAELLKI